MSADVGRGAPGAEDRAGHAGGVGVEVESVGTSDAYTRLVCHAFLALGSVVAHDALS